MIRAAITLKLNAYEDTGAIVAAMTTSIPEAADSGRNWDYRFCWLRDGYFVVNALNRLGATRTMERICATRRRRSRPPRRQRAAGLPHQRASALDERLERRYPDTAAWARCASATRRAAGPARRVRLGVLAAAHVFFDQRSRAAATSRCSSAWSRSARRRAMYDQPDAGLWELRGGARVHTFSSVMCWAACDRLARIAAGVGSPSARRAGAPGRRLRRAILERAWSDGATFVATFDGTGARREPAAAGRPRFRRAEGSALRGDRQGDRGGAQRRRFRVPLREPTISASRRTRSSSARSGRSTRWRARPRATRRARCSSLLSCRNARPPRRASRRRHRRAVGQLRADVQHGRIINAALRLSKPWDTMV